MILKKTAFKYATYSYMEELIKSTKKRRKALKELKEILNKYEDDIGQDKNSIWNKGYISGIENVLLTIERLKNEKNK